MNNLWMTLFGVLVLTVSLASILIPWHHEVKKRYADWHHRMMQEAYWSGYNAAIAQIQEATDEKQN